MLNGKSTFVPALLVLSLSLSAPAFSKTNIDVDGFLKSANLTKIIGSDIALNLEAQLSDPNAATTQISDLGDFIVLTDIGNEATAVEFDQFQNVLQSKNYKAPWLGVATYQQKDIPQVSLQNGLQLVQECMADKGDPTPNEITRLVIYKTLNTTEMVYDYVFKDPNYDAGVCREVLYTPSTEDCERGMLVHCHNDLAIAMLEKKFRGKIGQQASS